MFKIHTTPPPQQLNRFAGAHNDSLDQMLDRIAFTWFTADGFYGPEQVTEMMRDGEPWFDAESCIEDYELDRVLDGDALSHMELNGYTQEDLAEAMRRFRVERPDMDQ